MAPRQTALGKYYWGLVASIVTLLAGGWTILAPFALGYQPYNGSWTDATKNDFWFGVGIVVVSLLAMGLFISSLLGALRAAGVVQPRPRPKPAPVVAAAPAAAPAATPSSDLERTMAVLAAALAADLNERRAPNPEQTSEPVTTHERRES